MSPISWSLLTVCLVRNPIVKSLSCTWLEVIWKSIDVILSASTFSERTDGFTNFPKMFLYKDRSWGCKQCSSLCKNWLVWVTHGITLWKKSKYTSVIGSSNRSWSRLNLGCTSFSDLKYDFKLSNYFKTRSTACSKLSQRVVTCLIMALYSWSQNVQYSFRPFFFLVYLSNQKYMSIHNSSTSALCIIWHGQPLKNIAELRSRILLI